MDASGSPVAGAAVTLLTFSTVSASDGSFSFSGVPTIKGDLVVQATDVLNNIPVLGYSAPVSPVRGGLTAAGVITLRPAPFISTLSPKSVLAGTSVGAAQVTGFNLTGTTFSFSPPGSITINSATIDPGGNSATLNLTVAASASGRFVLNGTNAAGPSNPAQKLGFIVGSTSYNTLTVPGSGPNADPDLDGLTNAQEIALGTDPVNPDTDGDLYPDGLEVLFGSNPLDPNSIPVLRQPNSYLASPPFSIENAIQPATGPSSHAISGLTLSILNGVTPGTAPHTYAISGLTLSILNGVTPGTSPHAYAISGLTFSILNGVTPGTSPHAYAISGLTFSILNGVTPGTSPHTYAISGLTFSILNGVTPGTSPHTYAISSLPFSMVNKVSPAPPSPATYAAVGATFSVLNGTRPSSSLPTGQSRSLSFLIPIDPAFLVDALARGAQTRNGKPVCMDSDGDGLCDSDELLIGTDPFKADTDGDGYPDGLELRLGSDPLNPRSIPDIRPPGYYATPPVSIFNTIPLVRSIPRRGGAINAKTNQ